MYFECIFLYFVPHQYSTSFFSERFDKDAANAILNQKALNADISSKLMRYKTEPDVRSLPRPQKPHMPHPYVRVAPPSPAPSSTDSYEGVPLGHYLFQGKMGERYKIHSQRGHASRPLTRPRPLPLQK